MGNRTVAVNRLKDTVIRNANVVWMEIPISPCLTLSILSQSSKDLWKEALVKELLSWKQEWFLNTSLLITACWDVATEGGLDQLKCP